MTITPENLFRPRRVALDLGEPRMPVTPIAYNENLMLADDGAGRRPFVDGDLRDTPRDGALSEGDSDGETNEPLPVAGEDIDVGLTQKGTGEDAVIRRETEI